MSNELSDPELSIWEGVAPDARTFLLLGSTVLADTIGRLLPRDWFLQHVTLSNLVTFGLFLAAILMARIGSSKSVTGGLGYLVDRVTDLLVIGLALSASPSMIGSLTEWPMSITSATKWSMLVSGVYIICAWLLLSLILKRVRGKKR